jgi:HEAT repeat protein
VAALALEARAARRQRIRGSLLDAAFTAGGSHAAAAWAAAAAAGLPAPAGFAPDAEAARAVLRLAARRSERRLAPALLRALEEEDATIRQRALEELARLAPLGRAEVATAARSLLADPLPQVRGAAYLLLGREDPAALDRVALGLEDRHGAVRRRAAEALGAAGAAGLPALEAALAHARPEVGRAALRGLGRNGSQRAAERVLASLRQDFDDVAQLGALHATLPTAPAWRPLSLAIHDFNRRTVDRVLLVLEAFGHERTLRHARVALAAKDARWRASAVEALAALPQRRFVAPVLRLLETLAGAVQPSSTAGADVDVDLTALCQHRDRWLRAAAVAVARALGREVPPSSSEDETMSRLLFLKQVPLFSDLTFDHLLAIDGALRRADYLAGETVCEQGSVGEDFYIISRGEIAVRVGPGGTEVARLGPGEFFGEMALFDDEPRSATCVATQPATLLVLDRQRFYSLLEQAPRLGVEICRMLSLRLRRAAQAKPAPTQSAAPGAPPRA